MPLEMSDQEWLLKTPFVSHETIERLKIFESLILKWQRSINLVSETNHLWQRHIIDSLQLIPLLPNAPYTIADLGSGGGFPGIILSIAGVKNICLIESDQRKAAFLRESIRQLSLDATVYNKRIETLDSTFDIITARACASLERLLSISKSLWSADSVGWFFKGKTYSQDIKNAGKHWQFDHQYFPSVTHPESVIVKISSVQRRE